MLRISKSKTLKIVVLLVSLSKWRVKIKNESSWVFQNIKFYAEIGAMYAVFNNCAPNSQELIDETFAIWSGKTTTNVQILIRVRWPRFTLVTNYSFDQSHYVLVSSLLNTYVSFYDHLNRSKILFYNTGKPKRFIANISV